METFYQPQQSKVSFLLSEQHHETEDPAASLTFNQRPSRLVICCGTSVQDQAQAQGTF